MKETEKQIPSFKKKLGNTTYTVKVHFDENSTETLVDKVKSLSATEQIMPRMERRLKMVNSSVPTPARLRVLMKNSCSQKENMSV